MLTTKRLNRKLNMINFRNIEYTPAYSCLFKRNVQLYNGIVSTIWWTNHLWLIAYGLYHTIRSSCSLLRSEYPGTCCEVDRRRPRREPKHRSALREANLAKNSQEAEPQHRRRSGGPSLCPKRVDKDHVEKRIVTSRREANFREPRTKNWEQSYHSTFADP